MLWRPFVLSCSSICFKQMALYYAPIFFAYLLSRSLLFPKFNIARLTVIAFATLATFAIIFAPLYFLGGGLKNIHQCIHRIFPFARGIFEDKVANFWCVTNVFVKYKERFTIQQLQLYSLIATVTGYPAMIMTLLHPKKHLLPYVLMTYYDVLFFFLAFKYMKLS